MSERLFTGLFLDQFERRLFNNNNRSDIQNQIEGSSFQHNVVSQIKVNFRTTSILDIVLPTTGCLELPLSILLVSAENKVVFKRQADKFDSTEMFT